MKKLVPLLALALLALAALACSASVDLGGDEAPRYQPSAEALEYQRQNEEGLAMAFVLVVWMMASGLRFLGGLMVDQASWPYIIIFGLLFIGGLAAMGVGATTLSGLHFLGGLVGIVLSLPWSFWGWKLFR